MNTLSPQLQTLLDNRLRYLPQNVGDAINSIDWSGKLIEIGHTFGLHVDELEDFQAVVLKSMIGLIAPDDFENQLISALALSPANADKVIRAVNAQVFEPIHDYVMRGSAAPADALQDSGIHIENPEAAAKAKPSRPDLGSPVTSIAFGSRDATPGDEPISAITPSSLDAVATLPLRQGGETAPADSDPYGDFFK